jgi:hypothetical protein
MTSRVREILGTASRDHSRLRRTGVVHVQSTRPGAVLAVNLCGVATWARQHDCLVVIRHSVGEFVETGDILFEVCGTSDLEIGRAYVKHTSEDRW